MGRAEQDGASHHARPRDPALAHRQHLGANLGDPCLGGADDGIEFIHAIERGRSGEGCSWRARGRIQSEQIVEVVAGVGGRRGVHPGSFSRDARKQIEEFFDCGWCVGLRVRVRHETS